MYHLRNRVIFLFLTTYSMSQASSTCPQNSVVYHGEGYTMCYWVTPGKYYPDAGHVKCQEDGGIIGEVLDADAHEFLKCAIPQISEQSLWIGYNDRDVEGHFVNWNGQQWAWHNLWGGGPSDSGGEDCVEFYVNVDEHVMWVWNDARCDQDTYRILCSKRLLDGEPVDRAYTRIVGQDFAYFYKVTTNIYSELGDVINMFDAVSDTGCLANGCVLNDNCFSAYFDTTNGACITFTCPKMDTDNTLNVPGDSPIWVVHNFQNITN